MQEKPPAGAVYLLNMTPMAQQRQFSASEKRGQVYERLRDAGSQYRAASADLKQRRIERDSAIVEATLQGLSRRDVAEASGVTVGRVQQILDRDDGTPTESSPS